MFKLKQIEYYKTSNWVDCLNQKHYYYPFWDKTPRRHKDILVHNFVKNLKPEDIYGLNTFPKGYRCSSSRKATYMTQTQRMMKIQGKRREESREDRDKRKGLSICSV